MVAKRNKAWLHTGPVEFDREVTFRRGSIGPGEKREVERMADFPAPSGGQIELDPDVFWHITGVGLTTDTPFICNGNLYMGGLWQIGPAQITYTGTGDMFTVNDGSFELSLINISSPTARTFNMNNTNPTVFRQLALNNTTVQACDVYANCLNTFISASDNGVGVCNNGITTNVSFPSPAAGISLRQFGFQQMQDGCVAINLNNSTLAVVEFTDIFFGQASGTGTGLSGLASSGNIVPGQVGSMRNSEFILVGGTSITPLANITTDDIRWFFRDNANLPDTFIRALNTISNNATNTVIAAVNTPVPIAGTWTIQNNSQFVQGAAGTSQLQYVGERDLQMALDVSITLRAITGSPPFRVTIHKNGSPIPGASVVLEPSTAVDLPGSIPWLEPLEQNDIIEVYVENLIDATDVLMTDGVMRVLGDL